jgi:hypothetical protein
MREAVDAADGAYRIEGDGEKGGVGTLRRRLPARRDPTLYEMAEYL